MLSFNALLTAAAEDKIHVKAETVAAYQAREDDTTPKSGGYAVVERITDDRKPAPYYMVRTYTSYKVPTGCDYAVRDADDGVEIAKSIITAWESGSDPAVEDDRCNLSGKYNPGKYWGEEK